MLTFTVENWGAPRTVTVTGVDDDALGDRGALVAHSAVGGGYGGVADTVAVTVTSGDTARLVVSSDSVAVGEGGTVTYTVALAARPSGAVTVMPASGGRHGGGRCRRRR